RPCDLSTGIGSRRRRRTRRSLQIDLRALPALRALVSESRSRRISKPSRHHDLGGRVAIEHAIATTFVQPVVQADEIDVVAGRENPAEADLPTEDAAVGIVLQV